MAMPNPFENASVLIIGKRGKTTLINHLVEKHRILVHQSDGYDNLGRNVVFDNTEYNNFLKQASIQKLFMGRVGFRCLAVETLIAVPPNIRQSFDYVFIFDDYIVANKVHIWKTYLQDLVGFGKFSDLLYRNRCILYDVRANTLTPYNFTP